MFKQSGCEDELFSSMKQSLVKNQTEDRHGFDKLAKAADLLNEAAAIFDQANMFSEAEDINEILKSLASAK